jgi:hypothetical protein
MMRYLVADELAVVKAHGLKRYPPAPPDFSGGVHGSAGVVSALGFEIVNTRGHDLSDSRMQSR